MKNGKLIVIEGSCDGIGKSTQYNMLINRLIEEKEIVYSHHFPSYGTSQGLPVEMYLKGVFGNPADLSPYFVNSLYATDRGVTWYEELKEKYDDGGIIILDRYTTSSLIYQSALIEDIDEKNKFIDYVIDYEYEKIGIGKPDMVIFLWAPFDLVTELRKNRVNNDGICNDIHERDLEFMRRVYDSAMYVANYLNWDMIQCDSFDKMRSIDDIHNDVYDKVHKLVLKK